MNIDAIHVRSARSDDRDHILAVHRDAFGDDEGPMIVSLLEEMLDDPTAEPIYSFVAESEKKIVGHVLFTSVTIDPASDSKMSNAQILAPLAVTRDLQGKGIGTRLVKDALQRLAAARRRARLRAWLPRSTILASGLSPPVCVASRLRIQFQRRTLTLGWFLN